MRWIWIDRIVELAPRQRMVAIKHVSLAEEHVHDHFAAEPDRSLPAAPVMPASLIIEGMAQTAGVLVGHAGDFREKVILAKISRAELTRDATAGATLRYTATLDRFDEAGAATRGVVEMSQPSAAGHTDPVEIGRIDLIFSHIDHNQSGVEFPKANFVFSETFRTLIRNSGVDAPF